MYVKIRIIVFSCHDLILIVQTSSKKYEILMCLLRVGQIWNNYKERGLWYQMNLYW